MDLLETYNEIVDIIDDVKKEIHSYIYSPSGQMWGIMNKPAIESLQKFHKRVHKLGYEIQNQLNNQED